MDPTTAAPERVWHEAMNGNGDADHAPTGRAAHPFTESPGSTPTAANAPDDPSDSLRNDLEEYDDIQTTLKDLHEQRAILDAEMVALRGEMINLEMAITEQESRRAGLLTSFHAYKASKSGVRGPSITKCFLTLTRYRRNLRALRTPLSR